MGHDISSFNQSGKQIGYVRFTAGDLNASLFYKLFDANHYNAGVSGSGDSIRLSIPQVEKALKKYQQLNDNDFLGWSPDFLKWQRNEMLKFIQNSLETAQKEGEVNILFF